MLQVTQTMRTGKVEMLDVPIPTLHDRFVLVRNAASVISAGTEKTKIDMGKKSMIEKARARPDLVKQVVRKLKAEGLGKTINTVKAKLDSPGPLGYSCAGIVLATGGLVPGIQPGDLVACGGGGYANHAEVVAVPRNLVVKVPEGVSADEAAFTTVGSIALQGLRLAEPLLGETFLVLGLGLLGQITVELLRANGCRVLATDLDADQVRRAESRGAIGLMPGSDIEAACRDLTGGHGVDGVLVTAATSSNQPIELCGAVTRSKGRVIVVGAVRMDIPREDYFKKEIRVVISRSYGPGRYDPFYEEQGNDYPMGYVRFTEQRNMQAFLELVSQGKVNIKNLTTHRFPASRVDEAYQLIEGQKTEPYLGILLQYDTARSGSTKPAEVPRAPARVDGKLGLSVYGAGSYATATLLPLLKNDSGVSLRGLATASGRTARGVADQFGFSHCAEDLAGLLDEGTDALLVATRHDTHAPAVVQGLQAGRHVYVEKPLALSVDELRAVRQASLQAPGRQLMVGFNRRFAPAAREVLEHFAAVPGPRVIQMRVNAGFLPPDHWTLDPQSGGGRIIGEGCHFVDLATALARSLPVSVHSYGVSKPGVAALLNDNVTISLAFADGSVANIVYTAGGSKALSKEYVEVHGGGRSAVIHDWKECVLYSGDDSTTRNTLRVQDKGQANMIAAWLKGLREGTPCVPADELLAVSLATVLSVESLALGTRLDVDLSILDTEATGEGGE